MNSINELIGKTLTKITGCQKGSEQIDLYTSDGAHYIFLHTQDCCESVSVEDVCGDVNDLIGSPILKASEDTNNDNPRTVSIGKNEYTDDSFTWTFYNLATIKGYVTIRWYGVSNGYYSEAVDFIKVENE